MLEKWKGENEWPECKAFMPETIRMGQSREARQDIIASGFSREQCANRYGYPCKYMRECRNWNYFNCMISKEGLEKRNKP